MYHMDLVSGELGGIDRTIVVNMSFDKKAFIKLLDEAGFFQESDYPEDFYPRLLESIEENANTYGETVFFKEDGDKEACIEFVKDVVKKGEKLAALLKEIEDKIDECVELADEVNLPFCVTTGATYSPSEGGWTHSHC